MSEVEVSQIKSKRFRYLYKYPKRSRYWVYRRWASEKAAQFSFSTGEASDEKLADQLGERAFHLWLGSESSEAKDQAILFSQFANESIERKLARPDSDFSPNSKRTSKNAIKKLVSGLGHLRLDQVTEDPWEDLIARELRENPTQKFFNRRKELRELMRRAHRLGLIKRLPDFRDPDPDTDVGQYLEDSIVRRLLKHSVTPETRLLISIMWKQGARPGEALRYEWSMIHFKEGKHGFIHIPREITKTRRARRIPLNPTVSKLLRKRRKSSKSPFLFPSPKHPDKPMGSYKTAWIGARRRAVKSLSEENEKRPNPELLALVKQIELADIYDLRRTFITNQARKGRSIVFVAKYCDTSVKMIERFYAKVHTSVMEEIAR